MPRYVVNPIADHEGCYAGIYDTDVNEFVVLVCNGHEAEIIAALFNNPVRGFSGDSCIERSEVPKYVPFKQIEIGQQFRNLDGKLFIRMGNHYDGGQPSVERSDPFDRFVVNAIALEEAKDERGRVMGTGQIVAFKDNEAVVLV